MRVNLLLKVAKLRFLAKDELEVEHGGGVVDQRFIHLVAVDEQVNVVLFQFDLLAFEGF